MLHYLVKIVDNSFVYVIILALLLLLLIRFFQGQRKIIINWGIALGVVASLVYAILKRNTGFAVREFYDLGVIIISLLALLLLWAIIWRIFKLEYKSKDIDWNL